MNVPEGLRYTQGHEWIALEGSLGRVGITDFAQDQLGDIVFVELPEVGRELRQGEAFGVVESVKSVSDLFSPVAGRVVRVNGALQDQPEMINTSPYDEGWIIEISVGDAAEVAALLDSSAYVQSLEGGH